MSPAMQAHFRLLSQLPVRVHRRRELEEKPKPVAGWAACVTVATLKRMRELEALGWLRQDIAKELNVSTVTIRKKLGPLTKAQKRVSRAAARLEKA